MIFLSNCRGTRVKEMRIMYLFALGVFLSSCSTTSPGHKISIERSSKEERTAKKIKDSRALYEMGEIEAAIANIAMAVDNSAYTPAHDEAYELLIKWLLQANKNDEAKRYG